MRAEDAAVLLVGHGSRDAEGNREFAELVRHLARRWPGRRVAGAFLELAEPGISDVLETLAGQGVREVWAVPVILLPARHVRDEIPEILARAARRWGLRVRYGRPLGLHPGVVQVMKDRLMEMGGASGETTVVLVGRGSSRTEANAQFYRIARTFWEESGVAWVEPCFVGITYPDVPTALRRAGALGTDRVVVVPYMLFTGVLMKRLAEWVADVRGERTGVRYELARYLAGHPRIEEIVAERVEELAKQASEGGDGDGEDFRDRVWTRQ
ncbi:MAG: sirohydrochlorin chelatase [Kyrpidia sp.]|nr:sirohydrochlorin chelatase [Kyrpidia sp.]